MKSPTELFNEATAALEAGNTRLADRRLFLAVRLAGFGHHLNEEAVQLAVDLAFNDDVTDFALGR